MSPVANITTSSTPKGADEAGRVVFFARVPPFVSPEEIKRLLSAYGRVEHVNLYRKWATARTSKGCGIATFMDHASAAAALEGLNGKFQFPGAEAPMVVEWVNQTQQPDKSKVAGANKMPTYDHHMHGAGPSLPGKEVCKSNSNNTSSNWNNAAGTVFAQNPAVATHHDAWRGHRHWGPSTSSEQTHLRQAANPLTSLPVDNTTPLVGVLSSMNNSQSPLALQMAGMMNANLPMPAFTGEFMQLDDGCRTPQAAGAAAPGAEYCGPWQHSNAAAYAASSASSSSLWQMQTDDRSIGRRTASSGSSSRRSSAASTVLESITEPGLEQLLQLRLQLDDVIRSRCADQNTPSIAAGTINKVPSEMHAAEILGSQIAGSGLPPAAMQQLQLQLLGMLPDGGCSTGLGSQALGLGAAAGDCTVVPGSLWPASAVAAVPNQPFLNASSMCYPGVLDAVGSMMPAAGHSAMGLVPSAVLPQQGLHGAVMAPTVYNHSVVPSLGTAVNPQTLAEQLML